MVIRLFSLPGELGGRHQYCSKLAMWSSHPFSGLNCWSGLLHTYQNQKFNFGFLFQNRDILKKKQDKAKEKCNGSKFWNKKSGVGEYAIDSLSKQRYLFTRNEADLVATLLLLYIKPLHQPEQISHVLNVTPLAPPYKHQKMPEADLAVCLTLLLVPTWGRG